MRSTRCPSSTQGASSSASSACAADVTVELTPGPMNPAAGIVRGKSAATSNSAASVAGLFTVLCMPGSATE